MKRNIETSLIDWIENGTKAMLVEGARQVGKTYSIRNALKQTKTSYFEINFIERPDILETLKNTDDISDFIDKIQLYSSKPLIKGKSIIFLDEIQKFPEIVTKIKFLVDEGSFKYILSGSLLGIELNGIKSIPVGYLEVLRMYPMNFYEFIEAVGVSQNKIDYLFECFKEQKPVDDLIHKKILSLFYTYLIVGGMPSVVDIFLKTKNLYDVDKEQKNIIQFYKADFTQYEKIDRKLRILSIYENIPSQLNKQNMRFIFTYLNKELKFDRYENSFLWLKDAGVSLPVYDVTALEEPLIISSAKNDFKLFLSDVGLLTSCYPFEIRNEIISNVDNSFNNGALFENFACQELVSNDLKPFYFKSKSIGEIDFTVEIDGKIYALEIKSGKSYDKHFSIDKVIESNKNIIPIVFCKDNIMKNKVLYLPIYMVGLLKNSQIKNKIINIDIDDLKN